VRVVSGTEVKKEKGKGRGRGERSGGKALGMSRGWEERGKEKESNKLRKGGERKIVRGGKKRGGKGEGKRKEGEREKKEKGPLKVDRRRRRQSCGLRKLKRSPKGRWKKTVEPKKGGEVGV